MAKSFKGVAYFSGTDLNVDWGHRAVELLAFITNVGGSVVFDAQTSRLRIAFGDDTVELAFVGGRTQGVVRPSPSAGAIIICLVALRNALGKLDLVDDSQEPIPSRIRQSNPLYAADWARVQAIGDTTGLLAGREFLRRNSGLIGRLI